jgi:hypothetical protein
MTGKVTKKQLLRRPRRSKLHEVDLRNVIDPDSDNSLDSSSESDQPTEREFVDLRDYVGGQDGTRIKLPFINKNKINAIHKSISDRLAILEAEEELQDELRQELRSGKSQSSPAGSVSDMSVYDYGTVKIEDIKSKTTTSKLKSNLEDSNHKYKLDLAKSKTSNYSTRSLVLPYKPLGPDPLPMRRIKRRQEDLLIKKAYYQGIGQESVIGFENNPETANNDKNFSLNDFLADPNDLENGHVGCSISTAYISKHTYNQICKILAEKIKLESNKYPNNVCFFSYI